MIIPEWKAAILEEMNALEKYKTWNFVKLPQGKSTVGCKWVFTIKHRADGSVKSIVAKGFAQTFGIDYNETFAPVVNLTQFEFFSHWLLTLTGLYINLILKMPF